MPVKKDGLKLVTEIINAANKAWTDDTILNYFNKPGEDHGDILARYIAQAIFNATVDIAIPHEAYYRAADMLSTAGDHLGGLADDLYDAGDAVNPEMKDADK